MDAANAAEAAAAEALKAAAEAERERRAAKAKARRFIATELLTTEQSYVANLEALHTVRQRHCFGGLHAFGWREVVFNSMGLLQFLAIHPCEWLREYNNAPLA